MMAMRRVSRTMCPRVSPTHPAFWRGGCCRFPTLPHDRALRTIPGISGRAGKVCAPGRGYPRHAGAPELGAAHAAGDLDARADGHKGTGPGEVLALDPRGDRGVRL